MTAEQILAEIEKMDNEERWVLLDKMYDLYFNKDNETAPLNLDY